MFWIYICSGWTEKSNFDSVGLKYQTSNMKALPNTV